VTNYRFYLFDREGHISKAHIAECDGVDDVQRTALALLASNEVAAAVEAWERHTLVYRAERPHRPASSSAA
jgi:uncharacterized membrane-anchored protein